MPPPLSVSLGVFFDSGMATEDAAGGDYVRSTGRLSTRAMFKSQEDKIRKLFAEVDQDHDGGVDSAEFWFIGNKLRDLVAREAGGEIGGEDGLGTFDGADTDTDGRVDWEEWKELLVAARDISGPNKFRNLVQQLQESLRKRRSSEHNLAMKITDAALKVKVNDAEKGAKKLTEVNKRTSEAKLQVEALRGVMDHIVLEMEESGGASLSEARLREILQSHAESRGVLNPSQVKKVYATLTDQKAGAYTDFRSKSEF